jgi:hypothetical protein
MRRTFYLLILGCVALVWLTHRMRIEMQKLTTGHPGDHALDMRVFGYGVEEVRGYFERLGPERRRRYLWMQTIWELAFILAYGIAGAAAGMSVSAALAGDGYSLLSWGPFVGGLLIVAAAVIDLDEGQAIRKLLKSWPRLDAAQVARASRATRLKWLSLIPGLALVLTGVVLAAIAKLKGL